MFSTVESFKSFVDDKGKTEVTLSTGDTFLCKPDTLEVASYEDETVEIVTEDYNLRFEVGSVVSVFYGFE